MRRRVGTRWAMIGAAAVLLLAAPLVLHAQSRAALGRARKLLERLKLVDGPGSGLDADTVRGVSPLVVRDANGAAVGTLVLDSPPTISLVRKVDGRAMRFDVTQAGFIDTLCPNFCFESIDCSGTPYRDASDALLPLVEVCGTTAYHPTGVAMTRTIAACQTSGGPCTRQPTPVDMSVTAFATFDTGGLGLTPPFRLDGP